MPEGGRLTIETARHRIEADSLLRLPPGDYVLLTVTDTGTGMSETTKQRLFEPFFTTKAIGKGTGLGLATVYAAVRQAHGAIRFESELGRGTAFQIYLPAVVDSVITPASSTSAELPRGNERILITDDDPAVLDVTENMLRSLGYNVRSCSSSVEALRLFHENPAEFDLLVTDAVMPGLSGPTLISRVREVRPALPVLLVSGYSEEAARSALSEPAVRLLPKPYVLSAIATLIRELLDAA